MSTTGDFPHVDALDATAYTIPTERPESDGTLQWDATTIVVVHARAGATVGLGYTYAPASAAVVVRDTLRELVLGADPMAIGSTWARMVAAVRNVGRPGIASEAISAVDIALWDLRARLLGISVADALGRVRDTVPIYGSGGFTSFDDDEMAEQLGGWVDQGIDRVKIKVGRDPPDDPRRVAHARSVIGPDRELMVDANGAYSRKQAAALAEDFAAQSVCWFEEPVSSDDLDGLRLLRDRAPAGMDIAAGEYGYDLTYFRNMLRAGAVDCLQADVTRCGGITSFVRVGALVDAMTLELSSHTAPQVSLHACAGIWHLRHLEYFSDHVRLEALLFDTPAEPIDGSLRPDVDRPGLGLELKRADAGRYQV